MAREEGFVYRGRSAEDVDQQANQSGSAYDKFISDRFPALTVEKGDHTFRILPPTWKNVKKYGKHWGLKIWVHRNVGAKDGTYLCLNEMKGEDCPICDFAKKLDAEGESEDAYQLRKQFLYVCWAIDRDDEKAGPQVWTVPWTLDREIGIRCKNKKTGEIILVDHPEEGFDVEFRREGKGLGTKYVGVGIARDSSAISDSEKRQAKWLAFVEENPIPDVLNFFEPDYIEKVLNAKTGDSDDDTPKKKKRPADEDDEKPKKKRPHADDDDEDEKPKKKKSVDEDDDEDEKPKKKRPPADEDDDEDEKPKKKKPVDDDEDEAPKKKKRPADEDDDEDEKPKGGSRKRVRVDEDDDEDEKPKKKKSVDEDDDEDEKPKKKKAVDDDEDEDASSSAKASLKSVKKRHVDEDDDEDEKPKKKKSVDEDDDEDEKPKKKKKPVDEDDD